MTKKDRDGIPHGRILPQKSRTMRCGPPPDCPGRPDSLPGSFRTVRCLSGHRYFCKRRYPFKKSGRYGITRTVRYDFPLRCRQRSTYSCNLSMNSTPSRWSTSCWKMTAVNPTTVSVTVRSASSV